MAAGVLVDAVGATVNALAEVITARAIATRVAELGEALADEYDGRVPIMVGVLKGALPFLTDLVRAIPIELEVDFLALTRFGEGGRVGLAIDVATPLSDRHVIVVEDIVDTGLTLTALLGLLGERQPASLAVVTLLDKVPRRLVEAPLAYRGFEVGDEFLLGYGLDWEGQYRNLRSIWAVMDLAEFAADPGVLAREVFGSSADRLLT